MGPKEVMPEQNTNGENWRNPDGTLKEGHPPLPGAGRPPGSLSIKDSIRKHLEEHPEEIEEIVQYFVKENRDLMWQMLEGKPPQALQHTGSMKQYVIRDEDTGDNAGDLQAPPEPAPNNAE